MKIVAVAEINLLDLFKFLSGQILKNQSEVVKSRSARIQKVHKFRNILTIGSVATTNRL